MRGDILPCPRLESQSELYIAIYLLMFVSCSDMRNRVTIVVVISAVIRDC